MPIKGFNTIEEQTKEKVYELYGTKKQLINKRKKTIKDIIILNRRTRIPYICDKSGKEFYLSWSKLNQGWKQKHIYKYGKKFKSNNINIIELYKNGQEVDEIVKKFDCERETILSILRKNNIKFDLKIEYYSSEQIKFLKDNYPKLGAVYCSTHLNKTVSSVKTKAQRLGLKIINSTEIIDGKNVKCADCEQILPFECFNKCHIRSNGLQRFCKKCRSKHRKEYDIYLKSNEEMRKDICLRRILSGAKGRAKKRNMEFDLNIDWFKKNLLEYCPILGTKFTFMERGEKSYGSSPSLDRIDNSKGYTKDNVIIISYRANAIKRDANINELEKISNFYKNLIQEKYSDYTI